MKEQLLPRNFVITQTARETADIFTWKLKPQDGKKFVFKPGQYNMIYVYGVGEAPISISGGPDELVHTTRAVGRVTNAMAALKKGAVVGVRGPFGTTWPMDKLEGKDIIFAAGGIGLAPLRPAIYHVLNNREKYGRCSLLIGAKKPEELIYRREISQWRARMDIEVMVTVDSAGKDWRGNTGVVTTLIPRAAFDPAKTAALVCGPEIMMRFAVKELCARGVSEENIHVTLERNMKCGLGLCGHCQLGPVFVCKDGPVFRYDGIKQWFLQKEA
ncbi:MAG: FAD/NAD(P)-binding protein [Elusimicrobiales bacterium]